LNKDKNHWKIKDGSFLKIAYVKEGCKMFKFNFLYYLLNVRAKFLSDVEGTE